MPQINDILANEKFKLVTNLITSNHLFTHVYTTDLISMVIKHGKDDPVLITQINADATLGVAVMLGLPAIILTEDNTFSNALVKKANDEEIAIITTSLTAAEVIIELVRMNLL